MSHHTCLPLFTAALALLTGLGLFTLPHTASAQESTGEQTHRERTRIEIERDQPDQDERAEPPRSDQERADVRVHVDDEPPRAERPHWMFTVGRNAIWGGLVGGLLGVGVYMLTGFDASPWIIAQFGGGGILVGAVTGVVEAFIVPDLYALKPPASTQWVQHEIPESFQLRLLRLEF